MASTCESRLERTVRTLATSTSHRNDSNSSPPVAPPSKALILFSVLGVPGPLEHCDVGCMLHDWLLSISLISDQPDFDTLRFFHREIREFLPLFRAGDFFFGEAGCNRLLFRIPSCLFDLHAKQTEDYSADDFRDSCLLDLVVSASKVEDGESFVLLLIGHGEYSMDGKFRLCLTTESSCTGEAWISKRQLELALMKCRGDVTIICNSCNSGDLESPLWELIASARPGQLADALMTSALGHIRGSAFSLSTLAQAVHDQGLIMPLPHSRRPLTTTEYDMVKLPDSPPLHSFSATNWPVSQPSSTPIHSFMTGMQECEQYLIYKAKNRFQYAGKSHKRQWHEILPIQLSQSLVDTAIPDNCSNNNSTTASRLNEIYHHRPTGGSSRIPSIPTLTHGRVQDYLGVLAPVFCIIPMCYRRDQRYLEQCQQFLQDPGSLTKAESTDLVEVLMTRHLHSLVVQSVARTLGWWTDPQTRPFLSLSERYGEFIIDDMINNGFPFKNFPLRVRAEFPGTGSAGDSASVWWLSERWDAQGRPVMLPGQWEDVLTIALAEAAKVALIH